MTRPQGVWTFTAGTNVGADVLLTGRPDRAVDARHRVGFQTAWNKATSETITASALDTGFGIKTVTSLAREGPAPVVTSSESLRWTRAIQVTPTGQPRRGGGCPGDQSVSCRPAFLVLDPV